MDFVMDHVKKITEPNVNKLPLAKAGTIWVSTKITAIILDTAYTVKCIRS